MRSKFQTFNRAMYLNVLVNFICSVLRTAVKCAYIMTATNPVTKPFLKTNSARCTRDLEFVH